MLRFEFGVVKTFYWSGARASQGELRATSSDRIRPPNAKWNTPTWRGVGDVRCNKIFISHNMPKDSDAASSIEQLFAFYSGSKMKMILRKTFRKRGDSGRPE